MSIKSIVSTACIALAAVSLPARVSLGEVTSASTESPSWSGKFRAVATEQQRAKRQRAVDQTVSEFFVLTRPIARKRIEAKTHIAAWVGIAQREDGVSIHFEGRATEDSPFHGSTKGKDPEGNEATFAARLQGTRLVQTITTEEGKRVNTFVMSPDGNLLLDVELSSTKFERPIKYSVSYDRE